MTAQTRTRRLFNERPPLPELRRFTTDEYEQLVQRGIFESDNRVELLCGEIIRMAAISGDHAVSVGEMMRWLVRGLPATADVRVQNPIRLPPDSEPEPDLAVIRGRDTDFRTAHPGPADILLIIEVSAASLPFDRQRKLPRYARAGIVEVWIVDLQHDLILVHRLPQRGRYTQITTHGRGEAIAPQAFPELTIAVDDVLGPVPAAEPEHTTQA